MAVSTRPWKNPGGLVSPSVHVSRVQHNTAVGLTPRDIGCGIRPDQIQPMSGKRVSRVSLVRRIPTCYSLEISLVAGQVWDLARCLGLDGAISVGAFGCATRLRQMSQLGRWYLVCGLFPVWDGIYM